MGWVKKPMTISVSNYFEDIVEDCNIDIEIIAILKAVSLIHAPHRYSEHCQNRVKSLKQII